MSDVVVRPADPDVDAAAVAAASTEAIPFVLHDERSIAHSMRQTDGDPLRLVAEVGGRLAGYATTVKDLDSARPNTMRANVIVVPEFRRRGVGTVLAERLERHWASSRATNVKGKATGEAAIAFAASRGFVPTRAERISRVALVDVPAPVDVPPGYTLRFLVDADERDLHRIDSAVVGDIPSDDGFAVIESFDEWRSVFIGPKTAPELTVLAYAGDEPVAVSLLERVGDRVWSALSGTHPDHRGRGLAKVVKTHSLARARELGVVEAFTNNDAANAPMLAVNTWLGYRLFADQRALNRELS